MEDRIQKIEKYIKEIGAQKLGFNSVKDVSVKEINRGGYNINYLVNIDNHKFVFRFNIDTYLDVENQTEYENEILKYLEKFDVAPKVFFIDTSKSFFEYDLLVEEFIENDKLIFGNDFLQNFGKLVKKLHSIPLPQGGLLIKNTNPLVDQWNFIKGRIDFIKSGNFNENFLRFINSYIDKANKYVSNFSNLFENKDICLNHRDLVIENVLQTDKGLRLIDWQAIMADDPSYDLAFFTCDIIIKWNLGRPLTDEEKQIFLNSYQSDEKMLEKIRVRQPMVYLELFVWIAYRTAYLRDKLAKNLVDEADKDFVQKRIAAYESFLDENRMKKYLNIFYNYA